MIKFCSYFVEHRETSELGSGIILARPSYPIHLLAVYTTRHVGRKGTTGAPSQLVNSQLVRLILEKYSLFRLSKVDLGNCILSKVLLKTRKLGNKSTKN